MLPFSAYLCHNFYKIQVILMKLHKLVQHYKGYILTNGHNFVMYFDKICLPSRTLNNTDMTIASILLKLLSSNFTHLFSITWAIFWMRAASLKWILTKISPFMDKENHRCDHNVYTIEAVFINLLKLVYKKPKATFQSRALVLLYIFI